MTLLSILLDSPLGKSHPCGIMTPLIEFQVAQLFLDFLFEFVAFGEHGGEFFGVGFHLGVKFVGGDIHVVYLDVEILAGAQAVAFFFDFVVGHDHAEVFDGFGLAEGGHDFLDFVVFEADFLEAVRVLVFLAEFACVNECDFVVVGLFAGLVEEEHAHVGAGVREYVARHADHAIDDVFVNDAFEDFVLDAGFRGDEPGGDDDGALAASLDAVYHVLDKAGVDGHALLFLVRDFRHACPEAGIPFLLDVVAGVAEIHLEGRIAHNVIELLEALAVVAFVVGFQEGVALHGVIEARNESVQEQVQLEHFVTALRDVLCKDRAAVFANLVAERHEQGAGACAGVVAFYVVQVSAIAYQEAGHDFRDGLGGVIFGVLAAACGVVILEQVFKDVREKVVVFGEGVFEAEVHEFIDKGAGEVCTLGVVGHKDGELFEDGDFRFLRGLGVEYVQVVLRDGDHGLVKDDVEIALGLLVPEVCNQVVGLEHRDFGRQEEAHLFAVGLGEFRVFLFPLVGLLESLQTRVIDFLEFVAELVGHKLVQKYLGDNLVFVAIIAHAIRLASGLERVDKGNGFVFDVHDIIYHPL